MMEVNFSEPMESESYIAEWIAGFLFITDKSTGHETMTRINNLRGQNITRGEFKGSCETHGFDRACQTFRKLAANT